VYVCDIGTPKVEVEAVLPVSMGLTSVALSTHSRFEVQILQSLLADGVVAAPALKC